MAFYSFGDIIIFLANETASLRIPVALLCFTFLFLFFLFSHDLLHPVVWRLRIGRFFFFNSFLPVYLLYHEL